MRPSDLLGGADRTLFVVLLSLSLGLPAIALGAVEVTTLGPLTYMRNPGRPSAYQNRFPGRPGPGVLHIRGTRASLAVVRLNGRIVASSRSLDLGASSFDVPVSLKEENLLEVTLLGKPGSSLSIRATQTIEAEGAGLIGPQGGVIEVTDTSSPVFGATLSVPPGAIPTAGIFTITGTNAPPFSDGNPGISAVDIQPSGLLLSKPASLTLSYRDEDLDPAVTLGEHTLALYTFDETAQQWVALETESVDPVANRVLSRAVNHFSSFILKDGTLACSFHQDFSQATLPVLLVHGFQNCGWGSGGTWGELPSLLLGRGIDVCELNYNTSPGVAAAASVLKDAVSKAIKDAKSTYGKAPGGLTVFAHSMGGLAARAAIESDPFRTVKIDRLVTLATPHLGTGFAYARSCWSALDMRPKSFFLEDAKAGINAIWRRQAARDLSSCDTDYHLYAARFDDVVSLDSALGTSWDSPWGLLPGILAHTPSSRATQERVEDCGPDGLTGCGHISVFEGEGIADVVTEKHGMWLRLLAIAQQAAWFDEGTTPTCPGPATPTVTGRVLWNGSPVADATIELKVYYYPLTSAQTLATTTSGPDGRFAILDADPGSSTGGLRSR
jgi:hypothetical protein